MSKYKAQGKKLKAESDLKLAEPHAKGTEITLVQPAKDNRWGRFHFTHYSRAYALLDVAREHYALSIIYLQECRKVPFDEKLGLRQIPDELRDKLDLHSMQFLMFLKTGLEYLTHEMLPTIDNIQETIHSTPKTNWDVVDLNLRIRALVNKLGITDPIPSSLFLLFDRRDIVEHPTSERIYNSTPAGWKNNHLAWALSGEIEGTLDKIIPFINKISETYIKYRDDNATPGYLTGVKRGMKAKDPFKK
jgi:hypothetical protein